MYITVGNADGEQVIEFAKPGGEARFAVGTPDAHGLPWKAWAGPNSRDLYLIVRSGNALSKWSFHDSGDWRLQHLEPHVRATGAERVVDQWRRPDPDENGLVHAITILTPASEIVSNGPYAMKGKVKWVPAAPSGHVVSIHLVILTTPDTVVQLAPGQFVLDVFPLADDTLALLIVMTQELQEQNIQMMADVRSRAASFAPEDLDDGDRLTPYGHDENGYRFVWDILYAPVADEST